MARDHDVVTVATASHLLGHPGLLGASDEMVDEHPQPVPRSGAEVRDDVDEIVHAAHVLHDDSDVA